MEKTPRGLYTLEWDGKNLTLNLLGKRSLTMSKLVAKDCAKNIRQALRSKLRK
jgi:hypothetical protein